MRELSVVLREMALVRAQVKEDVELRNRLLAPLERELKQIGGQMELPELGPPGSSQAAGDRRPKQG